MGTYRINYEPAGEETIVETAREMVALANEHKVPVETTFNYVHLVVEPGETPEQVVAKFFKEFFTKL